MTATAIRPAAAGRRAQPVLALALVLAAAVIGDGALHQLLAQSPFGVGRATPDPQVGGVVGWLLEMQSYFYRQISGTIRAARQDGSAVSRCSGSPSPTACFMPPAPATARR
jgi:hypothetical protein